MQIKQGTYCPLIKKDCIGLQCSWFTQVRGTNPNTGKEVDEWACAIAWMPVLLIENSQQQRSTGSAVESFRNEMVKANEQSQAVMLAVAERNRVSALEIEK
jgi:hypothetical protein